MSERLHAFVARYSDSTFTDTHEVARPDDPEDRRGTFTHMGAQFWGFETPRHRGHQVIGAEIAFDGDAHHELVLRLHHPARVDGIDVSTKWFTGNQVRAVAVDLRDEGGAWREALPRTDLDPDAEHSFELRPSDAVEARLRCYPEGGISRVQLRGQPRPHAHAPRRNLLESARISHVSNDHYGDPSMAVRGRREQSHMIGWESARTGFGERAVFSLERPARLDSFVVDTYMHRLNAPLSCHLFALPPEADVDAALAHGAPRWTLRWPDGQELAPEHFGDWMRAGRWRELDRPDPERFSVRLQQHPDSAFEALLPFAALEPDCWHRFELTREMTVGHLLFLFYPNGGIHGLAAYGSSP